MASYNGKQKIAFGKRLGKSWQDLADYFEIPVSRQQQYEQGQEAREIWTWLEQTGKLNELAAALKYIDRADIVLQVLHSPEENPAPKQPATLTGSPYPGLRAFSEDESALFFGRDAEIRALLEILRRNRFVAVIGASGSGKSSLVRAGVLPRLKDIQDDQHWEYVRFTPGGIGNDPFMALAAALPPSLEKLKLPVREIAEQLYKRGNIAEIAEKYLRQKPASGQLLLFIDQFEELFTQVTDINSRQRFIKLLENAIQSPYLRIILTVRADFYEHCLNYPELARLINSGARHLASPDILALWQMIQMPAEAAGLQFETALVEQILRDTGNGSGALALMAFALEQLYLGCAPATILTWEAYERLGRVSKAIGRHAQETYDNLDQSAQTALDEVFAELVTVDPERGVASRKRANFERISQTPAAGELIEAFIQARLLVKYQLNDTDANTAVAFQETMVEVAHEAVLTHWDLLKNWIKERFDDFCLLRQVQMEAAEWRRSGCPETNLWPHERLQKVHIMLQKLKPRLSESVCAFIRPEAERLLEKLQNPDLPHQQRERLGVRLTEIGDIRYGVGLNANGLPQFDWCSVPSGRIQLEEHTEIMNVEVFFISRYQVTFKQYHAFIVAGDGYQNSDWWSDLRHDPDCGEQFRKMDNHPTENVSWFDAVAFCRWLSYKLGFTIRLPKEWEWQQAATGGEPEKMYPWGSPFESKRCNTFESGLARTTAVGLCPFGASPIGVLDMSGNVWEWCANGYDQPESMEFTIDDHRVGRGGSWASDQAGARTSCRSRIIPDLRGDGLGFRVVCSSPVDIDQLLPR